MLVSLELTNCRNNHICQVLFVKYNANRQMLIGTDFNTTIGFLVIITALSSQHNKLDPDINSIA